jgi:hypothetical protein
MTAPSQEVRPLLDGLPPFQDLRKAVKVRLQPTITAIQLRNIPRRHPPDHTSTTRSLPRRSRIQHRQGATTNLSSHHRQTRTTLQGLATTMTLANNNIKALLNMHNTQVHRPTVSRGIARQI